MKVTKEQPEKVFTPFSITIEFDTLEEAQELYMICNYSPIVQKTLPYIDLTKIRDAIDVEYYDRWIDFDKRMGDNVHNQ